MSDHLTQISLLHFVAVAPTDFVIAAGAAGFVNTDISAIIPARATVVWFRDVYNEVSGANGVGVREVGSTESVNGNAQVPWLAGVIGQRVELYRAAVGDNHYVALGYFG